MSFAAAGRAGPYRTKFRILSLEDAKLLPIPIRPLRQEFWTRENSRGIWDRMKQHPWMLSDETKGQFRDLMAATQAGAVHWFEIGDGFGLIHVFNIDPNGIGEIVIEIVGDHRKFLRKYGVGAECKKVALQALFKWLKVRKLRAFIVAENKASLMLARRCGFEVEGMLRQEWLVNGVPQDVVVLGLMATEVENGRNTEVHGSDRRPDSEAHGVLGREDGAAGDDVPGAASSGEESGPVDVSGDHGPAILFGGPEGVRPGAELH